MTTLTCEHCESEIDVEKDPKCVVYDPSGSTDVICESCRERMRVDEIDRLHRSIDAEIYQIKRGWRA